MDPAPPADQEAAPNPPTRRPGTVLMSTVIVLGVLALIAPILTTSVTSDNQYHYLLSHSRVAGNLLNLPGWTVDDMQWRLYQGRIAPVGVFVQHVQYFLGLSAAQWLGTELYVVEGATRALLILMVVAAFGWLARELYGRGGRADAVTVLFGVLFATGATAIVTQRNGWTTFIVLCLGTVALTFASAAVVLTAARTWHRCGRLGHGLWLGGLVLAGVALVLFYEMAVAAAVFTTVIVLTRWWRSRGSAGSSMLLLPWLVFTGGAAVTLAVTRAIIRMYSCQGPDCYPGFQPMFGQDWPVTAFREVTGAVPITGGVVALAVDGRDGLHTTIAALVVFAVIGAVTLGLTGVAARRAVRTEVDASRGTMPLLLAAGVTLVVTALVMSVSRQAQEEIVTGLTSTYRSTPLLWAMFCVLLAPPLAIALSRPRAAVGVLATLAVWGAMLGALNIPVSSEAARLERGRGFGVGEAVMKAVVLGPSVYTERQRCEMVRADEEISRVPRVRVMQLAPKEAYVSLWGAPMCPAKP